MRPRITLEQIQARATQKIFERGLSYQQRGMIERTVRHGNEIEALSRGSNPFPYRVRAVFNQDGVVSTSCTCLYDWGGDCKHVVALLLTYCNKPQAFQDQPTMAEQLMQRNKGELVDLIVKMLDLNPNLEPLLDGEEPYDYEFYDY